MSVLFIVSWTLTSPWLPADSPVTGSQPLSQCSARGVLYQARGQSLAYTHAQCSSPIHWVITALTGALTIKKLSEEHTGQGTNLLNRVGTPEFTPRILRLSSAPKLETKMRVREKEGWWVKLNERSVESPVPCICPVEQLWEMQRVYLEKSAVAAALWTFRHHLHTSHSDLRVSLSHPVDTYQQANKAKRGTVYRVE